MTARTGGARRGTAQITAARAARLHRLVELLSQGARTRPDLLRELGIGLRTFYRELDFLRRCRIKIRLNRGEYALVGSLVKAEAVLPFPDPRLSFSETAELARGRSQAAKRLAGLLESVLDASKGQDSNAEDPGKRRPAAETRSGKESAEGKSHTGSLG